jgi:enoyl-CoA hydratase/carnithine racemase
MDNELFKVEKTGTFSSHDGTKRTFVVAGTDIPADQARDLGLLNDKRAGELKAAAEQAAKQASSDFEDVGPEVKTKGAAPENKSA